MTQTVKEQQKVAMTVGGKEEKPSIRQMGGTYFYSSAITDNKNVFVTPEYMDLLVNAFKMAEIKQDVKNIAYCVMPNHFMWVFKLSDDKDDPVEVYKEVKKTVALDMIKLLIEESKEENEHYKIYDLFQSNEKIARSNPRRILWTFKQKAKELEKGRYKVFNGKSRLFLLEDDNNLERNLKYVCNAPVQERWNIVDNFTDYPYLFISEDYMDKVNN